jgi:hypothetical protein
VHTTRPRDLLSSPLGLRLLELISRTEADRLSDDELSYLLLEARSDVSIYQGDYHELVADLKSRAEQLNTRAEWLCQRMAHAWDDLDRGRQVWVAPSAGPAEATRMVADVSAYSLEVSKPRRAFWTCTFDSAVISPWLEWIRLGEDPRLGPYYTWIVTVSASARVFEIHSPASWAALAQAYPSGPVAFRYSPQNDRSASYARLDPDWSSVSQDWDGVHLSTGGWLTTEYVPHQSGGRTTELRGWDMESTAWFRWSFSSVEPFDAALPER